MVPTPRIWLASFGWLAIICIGLFMYAKEQRIPTGFNRGIIYQARQLQVLDLKFNSWYLAGLGDDRIYLGNITAPLGLLSCNYTLQDTLHKILPLSPSFKENWKGVRVRVLQDKPYLLDQKASLEGMHFDLMQLLSPGSMVVNGYERTIGQKSVQKVWMGNTLQMDKCQSYAHELQASGNFSIDGFITINKKQNAVLFSYYYRNRFVCLDTNLNLRYVGKTIDTNTVAKVKIEALEVNGKKVETLTGTPVMVSKRAYSDGNFFYLQSALQADNEQLRLFESPVTIDVYQLDNGAYSHSLYLENYQGLMLTGFAVHGNLLIALYERYLLTYSIDTNKIPLKN